MAFAAGHVRYHPFSSKLPPLTNFAALYDSALGVRGAPYGSSEGGI